MFAFLQEQLATILVSLGLLALIALALYALYRGKKKNPHGGCGAGCSSCPYSGKCHPK